jgi:hypothetical protein
MKITSIFYLILTLSLPAIFGFKSNKAEQTIRVTLLSINCISADDYGGSEELYGKMWALNLSKFNSLKDAKNAFLFDELDKPAFNSPEIWRVGYEGTVVLKKGQSRDISKSTEIVCRNSTDKILIIGDLNERDYRDADDYLQSRGTIDNYVISISQLSNSITKTLVFKSGGTNVTMVVKIEKV